MKSFTTGCWNLVQSENEWYASQLTDAEERLLTYGQDLDKKISFLTERFGLPKNVGMAQLLKEKYTINDATRHGEPREYAITIVYAAKVVKLDVVHNQLDIIWNGLDVEFQSDIDPPDVDTTLNQFLKNRYMGAGSGCSGTLVLRASFYSLTS